MVNTMDQKAIKLGKKESLQFELYQEFMDKEIENFEKRKANLEGQVKDLKSKLKTLTAKQVTLNEKQTETLELAQTLTTQDQEANAAWAEELNNTITALQEINATFDAMKDAKEQLQTAEETGGVTENVSQVQAFGKDGQAASLVKVNTSDTGSKVQSKLGVQESVVKSLVSKHPSLLELVSSDEEAILLDLAMAANSKHIAVPTKAPVDSHVGEVIHIFKKMMTSLDDKRRETTVAKLRAEGDFALQSAQRNESITLAQETRDSQAASLLAVGNEYTSATGDLNEAKDDLKTTTESLKDSKLELKTSVQDFKTREYMRDQEHQAFETGLRILQQVSGIQAPSLVQDQTFPVMKSVQKKMHAINLLHEAAHRSHSQILHHLTSELENGNVPVTKVGKKIELTIDKQMTSIGDSQLSDDKKKAWCEREVKKTTIERDHKVAKMKQNADQIEVTEADIDALVNAIDQKTEDLATAKEDIHEAKMLRMKAKNENKESITDAKDGQESLQMAVAHVRKFYDEAKLASDIAASFVQVSSREGKPETGFEGEGGYTGVGGSDGSPGQALLQVFETALADYGEMEATTKAQEAKQQADFETKMTDLKKLVAESETEIELKKSEKSRLSEELQGLIELQRLEDREKTTVENYLKEVNTECYGGSSSFESRAAERKSELSGLNESMVTIADAFNVTTDTSLLRSQARRNPSTFLAPSQ